MALVFQTLIKAWLRHHTFGIIETQLTRTQNTWKCPYSILRLYSIKCFIDPIVLLTSIFNKVIYKLCVCVWEYMFAHMCAGACRCQKRIWDPLNLESQVTVSHLTWVLGTKLGSSLRAALNCWATFLFM